MILVDTSVWIDYFNGVENWQTDSLDRLLIQETVLIGDIILTEILQGFDSDNDFKKAKEALDPLDCVHLGGKELAIQAASNYRLLRAKGITIRKTVDMLIANWCISHTVELLHNDKDFERIAGELALGIYGA
ncbi:type II toxin-antitoxin system VapC family toxin [Rhodohalobacter sp. 614A]|uniref:type II toxin-antitoxin system VapC family toxin n=1 Tax=Rhodohalobacter sp. 614A TaxID=2908649 RepID=UPI001F2E80B9